MFRMNTITTLSNHLKRKATTIKHFFFPPPQKTTPQPSTLLALPVEILHLILKRLSLIDIHHVALSHSTLQRRTRSLSRSFLYAVKHGHNKETRAGTYNDIKLRLEKQAQEEVLIRRIEKIIWLHEQIPSTLLAVTNVSFFILLSLPFKEEVTSSFIYKTLLFYLTIPAIANSGLGLARQFGVPCKFFDKSGDQRVAAYREAPFKLCLK